jgi:hypothetical protein
VKHNVLRGHTGSEVTVDLDAHVLRLALEDSRGGEDMLDLRGSDTEGEGTESTVGRSVGVAADDGGTGESETLLGANTLQEKRVRGGEGRNQGEERT